MDLTYLNPFLRRESHTPLCLTAYRAFTILSWILSVVVSVYYAFEIPRDGKYLGHTIWDESASFKTAFSLNALITSLYWLGLFLVQLLYIGNLFSSDETKVKDAANVGSHYIANNLLHFAFVMFFVRSYLGWAELMIIINLANLTACYCRHNTYDKLTHWPAISAPLAWNYVALYWIGAMTVPRPDSLVARIFGNIFIWSFLFYGLTYFCLYQDYTMTFSLSGLMAALGVAQFLDNTIALQWIFAFIIMGILFAASVGLAVPIWMGKEIKFRTTEVATDAEQAPLLADEPPPAAPAAE